MVQKKKKEINLYQSQKLVNIHKKFLYKKWIKKVELIFSIHNVRVEKDYAIVSRERKRSVKGNFEIFNETTRPETSG